MTFFFFFLFNFILLHCKFLFFYLYKGEKKKIGSIVSRVYSHEWTEKYF